MTKPIEAILIGAGQRGAESYAPYALQHPDQLRFVAVAEPDPGRRARFAAQHGIPPDRQCEFWEELLARPQFAEAVLVCTQDWQHTAPAMAAMQAGYHVLLEKPMATTADECRQLVRTSEETNRQLHICHVLRYTKHFQTMRKILQSGVLGEVIDVAHRENVGYFHMAHSYVRGNWRNSSQSSPMILAKCCHDFDILLWLLSELSQPGGPPARKCLRLSSAGSLAHFRPENAPPGAPQRCLEGCPASKSCLYYAPWIYLDLVPFWRSFTETATGFPAWATRTYLEKPWLIRGLAKIFPPLRQITEYRGWPLSVLTPDPTRENILKALQEGPYGRCVYHCDNDVVDHQTVLMEFEGGLPVTLTMHGHSHIEYRTTRIEGTRARLLAEFGNGGSFIQIDEHHNDRTTRYNTSPSGSSGHGGGDHALMKAFVDSIRGRGEGAFTMARAALTSHLMAFAAEEARLNGGVVEAEAFE